MDQAVITILEGPDGAGKSTLAKTLLQHDHLARGTHFGPPPRSIGNQVSPAFLQYLNYLAGYWFQQRQQPFHLVLDRFCYGELAYGPIYRQDHSFEPWMVRMLERVLFACETALVVCLPPYQRVKANWELRKGQELLQQESQLRQVYEFYADGLYQRSTSSSISIKPVSYDYTYHGPSGMSGADLLSALTPFRTRKNRGPGIGHFAEGGVLLVGEQVNSSVERNGWPFVATLGSSVWLTKQLHEAKVAESQLYWINAKDPEGYATDHRFIEWLKPRVVVTMGQLAHVWAMKREVSHEAVPHPAYWSRFHRPDEQYPLIEVLKRAHA